MVAGKQNNSAAVLSFDFSTGNSNGAQGDRSRNSNPRV